jgi:hypothetical protein
LRRWLAYSLAVALVAVAYLLWTAPSRWPIQPFRAGVLASALSAQSSGAPPLVGRAALAPGVVRDVAPRARGYLALTPGDDAGIYVYAPLLARAGGSSDALDGVRWLYALLFGFTAGIYPLVFRSLFRSRVVGLVAPWVLLLGLREAVGFHDIYWILAWAVLTLLPPLMVLARRWPRRGLAVAVAVMLGASFASSIRSSAGLPVLVAGAVLVLLQPWRPRRRVLVFAAMLAAYLAIAPLGFSALGRVRDGWLGTGAFSAQRGHGVWHSAYIGLGYMPNGYGLHYRDSDGVRAGQRSKPGVRYLAGDYEATMRDVFVSMARRDPGFVARVAGDKAVVMLGLEPFAGAALVALLCAVVMCVFSRSRRVLRRYVILVLPAAVLGLAPAIAVVPNPVYASGYLAAVLLMLLLGLGYVLSAVSGAAAAASELFAARPSWGALSWRGRGALAAAAVTAGLVVFSALAAPAMRARADAWAASRANQSAERRWNRTIQPEGCSGVRLR